MDEKPFNPYEGMTLLDQMAAQMNEMFNALMKSGFSEKQALYLVGMAMELGMRDESE